MMRQLILGYLLVISSFQLQAECLPLAGAIKPLLQSYHNQELPINLEHTLRLPLQEGVWGEISLEGRIFAKSKSKQLPIIDLTAQFRRVHGKTTSLEAFKGVIFIAQLIGPGREYDFIPGAKGMLGESGAILLLPLYEPSNNASPEDLEALLAAHCKRMGTHAYLIHSGKMDPELAARIPSFFMKKEDLDKLMVSMFASTGEGSNMKEVMQKSNTVERPIILSTQAIVNMVVDKRTLWQRIINARYGRQNKDYPVITSAGLERIRKLEHSGQLFNLVSYNRQREINHEISMGWYLALENYIKSMDILQKSIQNWNSKISAARNNPEQLKALMREYGDAVSEVYGASEVAMKAVKENRETLIAAKIDVDGYLVKLTEYRQQLEDSFLIVGKSMDDIDHIQESKKIDLVALDKDKQNVVNDSCTLTAFSDNIQPFFMSIDKYKVKTYGKVIAQPIKTQSINGIDIYRYNINAYLNVDDLRRIQVEKANSKLPSSSCSVQYSFLSHNLAANSSGGLSGGSVIRRTQNLCFTYSYPCWRNWKTYTCKTTKKRLLFHITHNIRFQFPILDLNKKARDFVAGNDEVRPWFSVLKPSVKLTLFTQDKNNSLYLNSSWQTKGMPKAAMCDIANQLKSILGN